MSIESSIQRLAGGVAGLSPARKLLLLMIASGVIGGGVVATRALRSAAYEPIFDRPLEAAETVQVTRHLSAGGVPFRLENGRIAVPAERKMDVLGDLLCADLMPASAQSGIDDALRGASIWDSASKIDQQYGRAREVTIQNVISHFPNVRKATVLIDTPSEHRIGGSSQPSAMVDIQTRGELTGVRRLASAAANVLLGAKASLTLERIQVTVDGVPVRLGGPETPEPAELLARREQQEQVYAAKLRRQLAFIPDVLISVSLEAPAAASTQPAESQPVEVAPADGQVPQPLLTASVAVPRSYFIRIFRSANPKEQDPSDGLLQPIIDCELDKVRKLARSTLAIRSDDDVAVECYYDLTPPGAPAAEIASVPLAALVRDHKREVAIGGGAVIGLLLLSVLLRRSSAVSVTSSQPVFASSFDGDADGDVDTLRRLVDEDPDRAAEIIAHWVEDER